MNLYTIDTGYFKLDGGAMFGVVPKVFYGVKQILLMITIFVLGPCAPY